MLDVGIQFLLIFIDLRVLWTRPGQIWQAKPPWMSYVLSNDPAGKTILDVTFFVLTMRVGTLGSRFDVRALVAVLSWPPR